jgi:hypothetical protein
MGGTRYTVEIAESMRRPLLVVDVCRKDLDLVQEIVCWLDDVKPAVLNVAGPRESGAPGVTEQAMRILRESFARASAPSSLPIRYLSGFRLEASS